MYIWSHGPHSGERDAFYALPRATRMEKMRGGQQRVVVVVIAKRSKIKYFFMFLPGNLDMVLEYLYRALCPPCVMRICMCDPCVAQFCAEETENEVPRRAAYESCVLLILKIY